MENSEVKWIVDPCGGGYPLEGKPNPGKDIVDWLDNWGRPFVPSVRYHWIKQSDKPMIWGGHKFHIGLVSEEDAEEFVGKWGGFKSEGYMIDDRFLTIPHNAWNRREFFHHPASERLVGDVLKFVTYLHHGERHWKCRGNGPRLVAFLQWLREQPKKEEKTDWPWYYWGFNDSSLDDYIWRVYKDDIFEEE